ncbi:MAG: hypothetical protein ACSHXK_16625 [Oceanococcus sp.]
MQIFNLFVATLASALSLVVLVVTLIHYLYLDVKPELIRDIPSLWITSILFGAVATAAWVCVWARLADHRFKLWFETGMALLGGASIATLLAILS